MSLSCLFSLAPAGAKPLQAMASCLSPSSEQRDHEHVPAVPACQQQLAFPASATKGRSNFLSHLAAVAHFICNSCNLRKVPGGLCEEEEEGAHMPPGMDKVLGPTWTSQLSVVFRYFHVCLQIIIVSFFSESRVANQQLFW